jgi:hypothetical protein
VTSKGLPEVDPGSTSGVTSEASRELNSNCETETPVPIPEAVPETTSSAFPELVSKSISEIVLVASHKSGPILEAGTLDVVPEVVPDTASKASPEAVPETAMEVTPEIPYGMISRHEGETYVVSFKEIPEREFHPGDRISHEGGGVSVIGCGKEGRVTILTDTGLIKRVHRDIISPEGPNIPEMEYEEIEVQPPTPLPADSIHQGSLPLSDLSAVPTDPPRLLDRVHISSKKKETR